jgi:SAM-dependent methyltransferase
MNRDASAPVTRGHGLLEGFLARRRAGRANRLIRPELRRGRILDVGCGSYPLFLSRTTFAEKFGLDQVAEQTHHDDPALKGITVVKFDVEQDGRFPFDDGSFDVVTALAVFEHIEPQRLVSLLAEVRRVLAPGGQVIMTTPAPWTGGILTLMAKLRLVSAVEIEEHEGAYSRAAIHTTLRDAGFHPDKIRSGYFELLMNTWCCAVK